MSTVNQTAQNVKDKAKEVASNVADTTSSLADKARDAGNKAVEKSDSAVESVGSGIKNFAGTIRENMPHQGVVGNASDSVANALESSGRYLEEKGLSGIGGDVTDLIKRNPIPALLIAVGVGFLLASATRSR